MTDQPPMAAEPEPAATATRVPGLDGVRALAVLAVLAFHQGLPWIPGGFLGVDIFFVLSGYLITDLLVAGYRKRGGIGLGRFYQRRARRLLPALAIMLITVTAAVSEVRAEVGDRWLVLINTFVRRSWEHEVNTALARAARRYPNVLLVNWYNTIVHRQGLLWNDDIHPQPVGGRLYAKIVRDVVLHALNRQPRLSAHRRTMTKSAHQTSFLPHPKYATLY